MADKNESARYRVSDAAEVPLRGYLLRLRVTGGNARLSALKGGRLRLTAPDGEERVVTIGDFSVMGGRASQERLERYGMVDVIVPAQEALRDGRAVGLGWSGVVVRD